MSKLCQAFDLSMIKRCYGSTSSRPKIFNVAYLLEIRIELMENLSTTEPCETFHLGTVGTHATEKQLSGNHVHPHWRKTIQE